MGKLTGKVAIVTGASKGIGAGIAKELASAGASVIVNYASSKEGADRVVAEITSQGGEGVAVHGDVSKAVEHPVLAPCCGDGERFRPVGRRGQGRRPPPIREVFS